MERDLKFVAFISFVLAVAGCDAAQSSNGAGGTGGAAGPGSGGSGGVAGGPGSGGTPGSGGSGGELGTPALDPLDAMPHYAVVSSDFSSTSIAMLDESFDIIDERWLDSGTQPPGLVATLSGDVVLPTFQAGDGSFAVVDRFLTDVVTQFFVPSGNLNGQVRTHGDVGDSGFSSNPQDIIFVAEDSAWIPRYESNLNPDAPPENRGNDLFEIDPTDMTATGARIDLSSLNTTELIDMGGSDPLEVEVFARPSRGVRVESTIVVGLDRISAAFDAAGPGMVAAVDVEEESVQGIELEGLASCGRVVPIPGSPSKVAVACVGFSNPFNDEAQLRASSGIAVLDVSDGNVDVERIWRVSDDDDADRAVASLIALDAERVLTVASGNFVDTTDTLFEINLQSGEQTPVYVSAGSFTIGISAWDPDSEMLYVPDAGANAVIELAADGDGFVEVGDKAIAPGLGLPPTQVYLLD
jgi:hypothetical protein